MDLRVSENTKLTGLPEGWANAPELQRVYLWDIGPEKPIVPEKPKAPIAIKEGTPAYDLMMIDFRQKVAEYEAALQSYRAAKAEYDDFTRRYGGPIELQFWSCDATASLRYDDEAVKGGRQTRLRYYISSRTRGSQHLPNRGLPDDLKPGPGQAAQEDRARQGEADLLAAKRADPVFGAEVPA